MKNPLVSVVINFHNEAENIDMAPLALSRQTYRDFEVILVDDGSTDRTAELTLEKYGTLLPHVTLIKVGKCLGLRPARNLGVKKSRGDIVITLDFHTIFDQKFIERIVRVFTDKEKVGAVGSLILPYGNEWFNCGMRVIEKVLFKLRRLRGYNYIFGTAAAYNAKALREIGYLSTNDIVEDVDASWKLAKHGWNILIAEGNVVFHKGPYKTFGGFLRKLFVGGVRGAFLFSKYKKKLFYPQYLIRFLLPFILIPLFLFPFILPFLIVIYLLVSTFAFIQISKESIRNSLLGIITFLLMIIISSLGLYYGLIARITRKSISID
jgi:biofilm PGA synthesis N-glycosyltransferase PgaC